MSRLRQLLRLICAICVGLIAFFFYIRNDASVSVDYFVGKAALRLPLLLLLVLAFGILLGYLCSVPHLLAMRRRNQGLKKRNDLATREIANLRALPLRDAS